MVRKVIPVVLRTEADQVQIFVFRYPLAGIQLVKGTVELGEALEVVALRELFEESGIEQALFYGFRVFILHLRVALMGIFIYAMFIKHLKINGHIIVQMMETWIFTSSCMI